MEYSEHDFIGVFRDAFSSRFCDDVVQFFEKASDSGLTVSRQMTNSGLSTLHQNDSQLFPYDVINGNILGSLQLEFVDTFWEKFYPIYAERFSALMESGSHGLYAMKVQKTQVGQGYHVWHYESGTRDTCHRLLSWILYLNDVEEGGETEFLYLGKRVKPTKGTLVLWPAGFTHTHRGNPPLSGTKYIMTGWVEF